MNRIPVSADRQIETLSGEKARLFRMLVERKTRRSEEIRRRDGSKGELPALVPASWAQERLWVIDRLEHGSSAYNIPIVARLSGSLDRRALVRTLDELVSRHEVLRTVFVEEDGAPKQEIVPRSSFELKVVDLRDRDHAAQEGELQLQRRQEAQAAFDLGAGPLIRGRLVCLAATEHVLLITVHHVVADGWSLGVLLREFGELYGAYAESRESPLSPLPIQYCDYALWQRETLQSPVLQGELAYWRSHLLGAPAQLDLPADRKRPASQSYRGGNVAIRLDSQLTASLKALAREHGLTLFMALYAGWALLVSRLSGQEDLVMGTPVANRRRPELEGLIGFFVNTVAMRVGVKPETSLPEFLAHVRQVTLGAYDHQDVPFERVVAELRPERSLSRNPIFQVMFALQNAPRGELRVPGLTVRLEEGHDEPAIFDLFFSLEERGEEIVGSLNYATDLFDRETTERWSGYFSLILREMTRGQVDHIGDLSILPEAARRGLVELFNETGQAYPTEELIHGLLEEQAARTPDAVAVEQEGQSLTYSQLNGRANRLARYLLSEGVVADEVVGICMERGLGMVVGLLGILKAGGAYLPLDPSYPRERLQQMLQDAAPKVLLTDRKLAGVLPTTGAQVIALDERSERLAGLGGENLSPLALGLSPQSLVYVIYTSGSTGYPKGTAMRHRSMVNLIEWHRRSFGGGQGKRVLQFAALSFDVAFQEIFSTLCTGGTLVLLEESLRRDARALMELLDRQSIERLFVPPLMLQSIAECCRGAEAVPLGLKDVITAGEQLRVTAEVRELFGRIEGCRLHNHYGPTETHVVTALTLDGDPGQWPDLPSIGRPIANTRIYVLDGRMQPVPIGVAGEIYIGGANVARGYLHRPELTEQRFVADPYSSDPQARLYKSGDLGRWRADGTIEYLGRNDDQVKIRGFRIELGEIEAQLSRHPEVKEAAVIAREEVPGEKRLVAYVTGRKGATRSAEDLRAHLKAVLPEYMVPSAFVALQELPLTPSGKLDRRALPAPDLSSYISQEYEAPRGKVEELLAGVWQELLKVERVGRNDNFFELGGHSLLVMRTVNLLEKRLNLRASPVTLLQNQTIKDLAKILAQKNGMDKTRESQSNPDCVKLSRYAAQGAIPLTYTQLQHWNLYRLDKTPTYRFVTEAVRISGPLNVECLQRSIAVLIQRHAALRTRIAVNAGTPVQVVAKSIDFELKVEHVKCANTKNSLSTDLMSGIDRVILEPIEITSPRLFDIRLFEIHNAESVLLLACEHVISDGMSLKLFFRDLLVTYHCIQCGIPVNLPLIGMTYSEHARLQNQLEKTWLRRHSASFTRKLAEYKRLTFPSTKHASAQDVSGWGIVHTAVDESTMRGVKIWAARARTTPVMAVFTGYAAQVLRWCNTADGVIQFMTNGRADERTANTFGFFAAPLHLRVSVSQRDSYVDLLRKITAEYCIAYEHADYSYLESRTPRPDFTMGPVFNWIPKASSEAENPQVVDSSGVSSGITCAQVPFDLPFLRVARRDGEPMIILYEMNGGAEGGVYFPKERFSTSEMQTFADGFAATIALLLAEPSARVLSAVL